jgi:hypothetical protein
MTTRAKLSFVLAATACVAALPFAPAWTSHPLPATRFQRPKWTFFEAADGRKFVKFETQVPLEVTWAELTTDYNPDSRNCVISVRFQGDVSTGRERAIRLIGPAQVTSSQTLVQSQKMAMFQPGPWLLRPMETRKVVVSTTRPCAS